MTTHSIRYYSEPDAVEYKKDSKLQYDLILGTETMKEFKISHLQLYQTIVLLTHRLRSEARSVSKTRLLSQASRYSEVAYLSHHCLSAGLRVPMQDWLTSHRCLVLNRPNTSDLQP